MIDSMGGPKPNGCAAKDRRSSGGCPDKPSAVAGSHELRRQILEVLEKHRVAGELLLQQHQAELRDAVESVCMAAEHTHTVPPSDELLAYQTSNDARSAAVSELPNSEPSTQEAKCFTGSRRDGHEAKSAIPSRPTWFFPSASPSPEKKRFVSKLIDRRREQNVTTTSLRHCLGAMIQHPAFDSLIGFFIILNTVVMFVQLEAEAPSQDAGKFVQPSSHMAFGLLSHVFNAIFFVELVIRLYVNFRHFFLKAFNWIEMLIVILTLFDAYVLSMVKSSGRQNISFMYMVRIIRVVRAVRVIRTLHLFTSLRVLINTIALSSQSLFWSMLILFLFMLMFALFMCQMLSAFLLDERNTDYGMKQWVFRYYGSSFRALWTVFEITFSGGWPNYARPLVENVDAYYAVFFAAYIMGVVVATVRIVFALFLKDTLQSAASDAEMVVAEKMKDVEGTTVRLSEVFRKADVSGDGYLSAEELQQIMTYPKVKVWMSTLGLDVSDTRLLFRMLDDGDGRISYDEFVSGILRLKGSSRAMDTIHIMRHCERISKHCEATHVVCEEVLAGLSVRGARVGQEPDPQRQRCPSGAEGPDDVVTF